MWRRTFATKHRLYIIKFAGTIRLGKSNPWRIKGLRRVKASVEWWRDGVWNERYWKHIVSKPVLLWYSDDFDQRERRGEVW